MTPKQEVLEQVDVKLRQSGWSIQNMDELNHLLRLPEPDVLADDIIENLRSALESFKELKAQLRS